MENLSLDEINEQMRIMQSERESLVFKTREYCIKLVCFGFYDDVTQGNIIKEAIEAYNSIKNINNEISKLTTLQIERMNEDIDDIISTLEAHR